MIINLKHLKCFLASCGIISIIFLWPFQLDIGNVTVPLYILTAPILILVTGFQRSDIRQIFFLSSIILALLFLQILFGAQFTTTARSLVAIPILSCMVIFVLRWLWVVEVNQAELLLFKVCRYFLGIQFLLQIFQVVLWKVGGYQTPYLHYAGILPRATGFFSEPSHLAVGMSPFIYLYICHFRFAKKIFRKKTMYNLLLILAICPSTTLIGVVSLAIIAYLVQVRPSFNSILKLFIACTLLIGSLIFLINHIPAVSGRLIDLFQMLFFHKEPYANMNVSALMYIKGSQMAISGLCHYPLGVGLLNMQSLNEFSGVSMLNDFLFRLNMYDGTSLLFKLFCEFGCLGIIIAGVSFWSLFKRSDSNTLMTMVKKMFVFGLVASFIRGSSYFDGVPLLGLAVVYRKLSLVFFKEVNRKVVTLYSARVPPPPPEG